MHDVHTHFVPDEVLNWMKENKETINAKWEKRDPNKEDFLVVNNKWAFELKKQFVDKALFLNEQEKAGVTHSLISAIPQLFLYDFDEEITSELASIYNKALSDWVKTDEERLSALATVPLNKPEKAAQELEAAMGLGLKGAIIGPGIGEKMLTDEFFSPFWEAANRLKAIIFIHPLLNNDPRLKKNMMPNLIGVPWETTICATDIVLSGLLDKYEDVKILLAHGGGFLPYQLGRLDTGYDMWKAVSKNLQAPPSEYVKKFWYDTVLWNENSLEFLIKQVGEERVVPGSDFPFDLSTWPPQISAEKGIQTLLAE